MNSDKVLVCLFSDVNFLALSILENLLSKNCYVLVVTDELERWESASYHIGSKSRFSFIKPKDIDKILYFNYIVVCGGFIRKENAYQAYNDFLNCRNLTAPKILAVFPFEAFSPKEDALLNVNSRLAAIYFGDLLGPRIDMTSNLLMSQVFSSVLRKREVRLPLGEVFYPMFVADAAKTLCKWLFSFGPYGKSMFLLGSQMSTTEFLSANQKTIGDIKFKQEKGGERRFVPRNYEVKSIVCNLRNSLYETYKWLSSIDTRNIPVIKIKKKIKYPKYFKPLVFSVLLILLLPLILIFLSLSALYLSYRDLEAGNFDAATSKILVGRTFLAAGAGESRLLKLIPGLGLLYRETEYISKVGERGSSLALEFAPAAKKASILFNNVLGDNVYDPSVSSQEINTNLLSAYRIFLEIKDETKDAQKRKVLAANLVLKKVDFDKVDTLFQQGKVLLDNLPSLLGAGGRKTYLVLFQNNMELRPTGGFIGSFGLLTFDGGRMSELTVNDVYSADGQLRGHVEPPAPIKNYLNEANWWLRDSNWDPDFPTSAQRAEWFLDKEIDQKVDGVFAIDLNLIKDVLNLTGPIFLPDYNLDVTNDNLYEETQAEVEEEFFPGSHRKASFLSALSRSLVVEAEKLGGGRKLRLLYTFGKNFEERHIQAYLHNDDLQNSVSVLGWGGEILEPYCGDSCYADLVGITEANLGVNKANYFVSRSVELDINANESFIERSMVLNLTNSANPALGEAGRYKVYLRVFVPLDSELVEVKRISGSYEEGLSPEISQSHGRQEVGVITEVLAGNSQKVAFIWRTKKETKLNLLGYGLYIRKQAGVSDDPWNIALTGSAQKTYNTTLSKDFFAKTSFLSE